MALTQIFPAANASEADTDHHRHTYGLNNEIHHMLEQDMSVKDAVAYHVQNWGFPGSSVGAHDYIHLIFALMLIKQQGHVAPSQYQGNLEAECYVAGLEMALHFRKNEMHDAPHKFSFHIEETFINDRITENANRTILWILEGITKRPALAIFQECDFHTEKLKKYAERHGLVIGGFHADSFGYMSFYVEHEGIKYGYDQDRYFEHWPEGSNGVSVFQPFYKPREAECHELFETILPFLAYFQHQMTTKDHSVANFHNMKEEILSNLTVRDIYKIIFGEDYKPSMSLQNTPESAP